MNWLALLLKFFPIVLQTVVSIQAALADTVPGAVKKGIVLSVVRAGGPVSTTEIEGVSTIIDTVVGHLKTQNVAGFAPFVTPAVAAGTPPKP